MGPAGRGVRCRRRSHRDPRPRRPNHLGRPGTCPDLGRRRGHLRDHRRSRRGTSRLQLRPARSRHHLPWSARGRPQAHRRGRPQAHRREGHHPLHPRGSQNRCSREARRCPGRRRGSLAGPPAHAALRRARGRPRTRPATHLPPAPPRIRSSPARPRITSSPPSPQITSRPSVPSSSSALGVPRIVQRAAPSPASAGDLTPIGWSTSADANTSVATTRQVDARPILQDAAIVLTASSVPGWNGRAGFNPALGPGAGGSTGPGSRRPRGARWHPGDRLRRDVARPLATCGRSPTPSATQGRRSRSIAAERRGSA